jgi:hypothetical protein
MSSGPRGTFPTSAVGRTATWYVVLYCTVTFGTPCIIAIHLVLAQQNQERMYQLTPVCPSPLTFRLQASSRVIQKPITFTSGNLKLRWQSTSLRHIRPEVLNCVS